MSGRGNQPRTGGGRKGKIENGITRVYRTLKNWAQTKSKSKSLSHMCVINSQDDVHLPFFPVWGFSF